MIYVENLSFNLGRGYIPPSLGRSWRPLGTLAEVIYIHHITKPELLLERGYTYKKRLSGLTR